MSPRRTLLTATIAALFPALAGCGDSEPKGPCVRSHQEQAPPVYVRSGNVLIPVPGGMHTVCDEYGPSPEAS